MSWSMSMSIHVCFCGHPYYHCPLCLVKEDAPREVDSRLVRWYCCLSKIREGMSCEATYQQSPLSCWPTPAVIQMVSPLIIALIDEGCTSGVIQATKLEQSVLAELSTDEVLAGSAELDSLARDFPCHMQAIFSLLRAMRAGRRPMRLASAGTCCTRS